MFDHVKCRYPLPDKEVQNVVFQTKNFECMLDTYFITEEGKLLMKGLKQRDPVLVRFHGELKFYTSTGSHEDNSFKWYEYIARFTNGKLQWIKRAEKEKSDT